MDKKKNPCIRCYGTGFVVSFLGKRRCTTCNGTGTFQEPAVKEEGK